MWGSYTLLERSYQEFGLLGKTSMSQCHDHCFKVHKDLWLHSNSDLRKTNREAGNFFKRSWFFKVTYSSYLLTIRHAYLIGHPFCSLVHVPASLPDLLVICGILLDIKPHEIHGHSYLQEQVGAYLWNFSSLSSYPADGVIFSPRLSCIFLSKGKPSHSWAWTFQARYFHIMWW